MTREQLFDCMVHNRSIIYDHNWVKITSIELEDGSGYNFNVQIRYDNGNHTTLFVRCPRPTHTLN